MKPTAPATTIAIPVALLELTRPPGRRLTIPAALAIRERLAAGESQARLAAEHGMTQSAISHIAAGRSWGWLGPRPVAPRRNGRPASKLDAAKVVAIRARVAAGESRSALAREYGVDPSTIRDVCRGRIWAWVQ